MWSPSKSNKLLELGIGYGVEDTRICSMKFCHLFNMFIMVCSYVTFKQLNILSHYIVALLDPSLFEWPSSTPSRCHACDPSMSPL